MIVQILNNNLEGTRGNRVGDHYARRFLKCHPSIATTVARAVDRDRVLALIEESLKTYFDDLEDCLRRNEVLPNDVWSFDEKGFMMGRRMNL